MWKKVKELLIMQQSVLNTACLYGKCSFLKSDSSSELCVNYMVKQYF